MKRKILLGLTIFVATSGIWLFHYISGVNAATTITVNSIADDIDPVDNECTLREAIVASNTNTASGPGVGECIAGSGVGDTIEFDIAGAAPHSIALTSGLPAIVQGVIIDGSTETGYVANTAVSPAPLNGTMVIEIDGSALPLNFSGTCFQVNGAGSTVFRALVINNCGGHGVYVNVSNNVVFEGNYIGTDVTGLIDEGNGRNYVISSIAEGIFLNASNNAVIGGTDPSDRNIVAGNQAGDIFIGNEANNVNPSGDNIIQGNYIGVGANGTTAIPGGHAFGLGNAILFGNSHDDLIGGTAVGAMNVIGSSWEFGVSFRDGCTGSIIEGNYIGTNYTGNTALTWAQGSGHIGDGIHVATVSSAGFTRPSYNIRIGGTSSAARNVVSGNSYVGVFNPDGIKVSDGSDRVTMLGNYIGVGANGTSDVGNEGDGIGIDSDAGILGNTIGGTAAGSRNVISGNSENGLTIFSAVAGSTALQGNYIGTNASGTAAIANVGFGISINGTNDLVIGGTATGAGNVISGNGNIGILLVSGADNGLVLGNIIGLTSDGETDLGNGSTGVAVSNSDNVTIGGTVSGAGNVISGNTLYGIGSDSTADGLLIQGNYIGSDDDGLVQNSNDGVGILLAGDNSTIGGTVSGARNVIVGNTDGGITVSNGSNGNFIRGNYIGVASNGSTVIMNGNAVNKQNISILGSDNTVGGTATGARNVIAGASASGILIAGPFSSSYTSGNIVQGNYIGTLADGSVTSNSGANVGVRVIADTFNNLVGGAGAGAGNLIRGNGSGVFVASLTPTLITGNNSIIGNSIYENTGGTVSQIGIDLLQTADFVTFVNAGVTPNDGGDLDTGTNNYQNFPVITSITSDGDDITFTYDLTVNALDAGVNGYRVDFYANVTADPSGNGQGQVYLGGDTGLTGNVTGRTVTIPNTALSTGTYAFSSVATATDASTDGFASSSEFSGVLGASIVNDNPGGGGSGGVLANTGRNIMIITALAAALLLTGAFVYRTRSKNSTGLNTGR